MASLLFDAPYWLMVILALIGGAVTYSALQRQQKGTRTTGYALLGIAALLLLLRLTVETPQKRVEKQSRALIEAISTNDWDSTARYFAHARLYQWEGSGIAARAKELSSRYGLTGIKINSLESRRDPNVITVILSVTSYHKGMYMDTVPSTWNLEYQERPAGWVLTNVVPVKIGFGDMGGKPEEIIGGR